MFDLGGASGVCRIELTVQNRGSDFMQYVVASIGGEDGADCGLKGILACLYFRKNTVLAEILKKIRLLLLN